MKKYSHNRKIFFLYAICTIGMLSNISIYAGSNALCAKVRLEDLLSSGSVRKKYRKRRSLDDLLSSGEDEENTNKNSFGTKAHEEEPKYFRYKKKSLNNLLYSGEKEENAEKNSYSEEKNESSKPKKKIEYFKYRKVSKNGYYLQVTQADRITTFEDVAGPPDSSKQDFIDVYFQTNDSRLDPNNLHKKCKSGAILQSKSFKLYKAYDGGIDYTHSCRFVVPKISKGFSFHFKGYPSVSLDF